MTIAKHTFYAIEDFSLLLNTLFKTPKVTVTPVTITERAAGRVLSKAKMKPATAPAGSIKA